MMIRNLHFDACQRKFYGKFSSRSIEPPNGPFNNVYYQFGEIHTNANDPWSQIGINAEIIAQTLYVSFTYARLPNANPSYTGDLAIDLIEVNSCSTCPSPSLSVQIILSSSAS